MTFPRFGVPSASGMLKVANCSASFQLEAQVEEEPLTEDQKAWGESGDKVHAYLAGTVPFDDLDAQEQQTAEMCERQAKSLVLEWSDGDETTSQTFQEVRLGLTSIGNVIEVTPETKASIVFTGQADLVIIEGDRGLIIDDKTLYGDHEEAVNNPQLFSLAVLWKIKHKLKSVRVALVQPWAGKPTIADLDEDELRLAESWLKTALERERQSTPEDTNPGKWCLWCKAKLSCKKFKDQQYLKLEVVQPMSIAELPGKEQRAAMFSRAVNLPAEKLAAAMRGLPMLERFVDSVKSAAKTRAEHDPEFQRFYVLEESAGDREFKGDAQQILDALAPHGVTAEALLACAKLSVTKVQDAVRKGSGVKSQTPKRTTYNLTADAAKDKLAEACGDLLGRGNPSKTIKPVMAIEE